MKGETAEQLIKNHLKNKNLIFIHGKQFTFEWIMNRFQFREFNKNQFGQFEYFFLLLKIYEEADWGFSNAKLIIFLWHFWLVNYLTCESELENV